MNSKIVIGYTTRRHLLLDLDYKNLVQTVGLVKHMQSSYPDLGDALILQTYPGKKYRSDWIYYLRGLFEVPKRARWHVVFDGELAYERCCEIIGTLVDLNVLDEWYRRIRDFRGDMTLRVSKRVERTRVVPIPKPVCLIRTNNSSNSGGGIAEYCEMKRFVDS